MRAVLAVLVVAAAAFAQCPLRLTPAEACQEGFARCALYVDSNGDQRCDNPGPQPVIDPEPEPADSIAVETPDDPEPVDPGIEETPSDPEPLIEEVVETSEEETVQETGETLEETVEREVLEEVSIKVRNIRYFGSQPWPFPHSLMVGFTAEWESGEIKADGVEIEDAGWYEPGSFPEMPPGISISRRLIDDFIFRKGGL